MNIARELQKKGDEVFVIDIDNIIDTTDYGFQRKTILCHKFENPGADLDFNFPCFTTHPRSLQTFYDLDETEIAQYVSTFKKITKQVCKKFKPDLIHAQHLWITPYVAAQTGVPYVITAHGTDLMGFRLDPRYHKYALPGAEKAKKIITISQQVHQDVKELYGLQENKLQLVPNGFDQDIFRIRDIQRSNLLQQFGVKNHPTHLVSFVGKFTKFKGIDTLLEAVPQISAIYPEIAFLLAGDGELRSQLEEFCADQQLSNVYFLGHQTQQNVSLLYNLADISVVPSRIEPFGLVAIEALACGTPVVATKAGGLPDFINSKVGRLVEMENPPALAQGIIAELAADAKQQKGKTAAKYALENYSWAHSIQTVREIYQS
jgi:glycosyltransferase involved in cell wall biosynthesis